MAVALLPASTVEDGSESDRHLRNRAFDSIDVAIDRLQLFAEAPHESVTIVHVIQIDRVRS
jgi:hypothetical protein